MKKIIILLFAVTLIFLFSKEKSSKVLIPNDAIRFRIIANSNSIEDQLEKLTIKKELEPVIVSLTNNTSDINEARKVINSNVDYLGDIVNKYTTDFNINYGFNYFPKKNYKGITYEAGNYESLVITLGDGLGDNWWCVLFPPLCLLEASGGNLDDVTYSFYIKDIIDRF